MASLLKRRVAHGNQPAVIVTTRPGRASALSTEMIHFGENAAVLA
jgi:hypothetical protein